MGLPNPAVVGDPPGWRLWDISRGAPQRSGLPRTRLYELHAAGLIEFVRVGGRTYVTEDALAAVVRRLTSGEIRVGGDAA
jgi:hypothetical protein